MRVYLIQFNVGNLEKAIQFYTEVLGFKLSKKHYHPPVAVDLVHGGIRLVLHRARFINNVYPPNGRTQVAIQVQNIEEELAGLKKRGVELIHRKPLDFPLGKYAAFKDPFGNIHELVELKKKSESKKRQR